MTNEKPPEMKSVEVRQGRSSGTVRYILIISMILILIAAFIFMYLY